MSVFEHCIAQIAFDIPALFVIFNVYLQTLHMFVTNRALFPFRVSLLASVDFYVPIEGVLTFQYFTAVLTGERRRRPILFPLLSEMGHAVFASGRRFGKGFTADVTFIWLFT